MTVSKNVQQGSFIYWMLSRQGISMRLISESYGCHFDSVSKVIWGKMKSESLESFIANILGFGSWDQLKEAEGAFNRSTDRFLRKLSAQEALA